jgi:uracil-DNA glycosylase family 4
VFTGDGGGGSADFLMAALHRAGFANRPTSQRADDGLQLHDAYIAAAVRCAPPDNKPTPEEIARCLEHLVAEVAELRRVQVVVTLGRIGFDAWLRVMRRAGARTSPRPQFGHGQIVTLGEGLPTIVGCYHPSRQNTNTGKLTATMMNAVFRTAKRLLA